MVQLVYILCSLSCLACAGLLIRGYLASRLGLLFWSAICFLILALGNLLLIFDLILFPAIDLTIWRSGVTLIGITVLLYGLIFESRKT